MGNQCNQPLCCKKYSQERFSIQIDLDRKQRSSEQYRLTRESFNKINSDAELSNSKSKSISHSSVSVSISMEEHQDKVGLSQTYRELFLTIDNRWMHNMKVSKSFPIDIFDVYQQILPESIVQECKNRQKYDYLTLKRFSHQNRKIQILFKEHIPRYGKYYFEIDLLQYSSKNKCKFTIGIADYFKAKTQLHIRDKQYEQSYTYSQQNKEVNQENKSETVKIHKKIVVQISRQKSQPFVSFYVGQRMISREPLKQELMNPKVTLVPYIQTQQEGIIFSWKEPIKVQLTEFAMAIILEEGSTTSPVKIRKGNKQRV